MAGINLNFPGAASDYSSLLGFGNSDYVPVSNYLPPSNLTPQVGGGSTSFEPSLMQSMFGWTDPTTQVKTMGAAGPIMGGLSSLMNGWMGMQQLDFAKKSLAQQKKQFDLNYGAQRTLANTAMEDRQRARIASNSGAYESLDSYMAKNKVV
jgi:hypothetical protein